MKKQKKQTVLNAIIVILVLVLIMMIGSIIYEEKINMNKQQTQNTSSPSVEKDYKDKEEDDNDTIVDEDELPVEEDKKEELKEEPTQVPTQEPTKIEEQYVGEEENNAQQEDTRSNDEKAIDLVKKQWGDDDSVTFSIEKKNGTKYYVAVKSGSTETVWYVVDTETWEVSEY